MFLNADLRSPQVLLHRDVPHTSCLCIHYENVQIQLASWSQLIHPKTNVKSTKFFRELSQSCVATLTHYSTEPQTTRPDYDPLLLLIAIAGDGHLRIYARIQWNRFVSSATSTTGTLNDLTTDLIMARSQQQQCPNLREIVPLDILLDHMITWQQCSSIYYRFIGRFLIGLDFLFITFIFLLHLLLSWTSSLSISSSAISASTLSNHVFLGLPTGLLPSTLYSIHFFTQSSSYVHTSSVYHF